MIAATIGALGTAAAAGINAATAEARNAKSYKYTKRLQDEQNKFNAQQAQIAYDRQRELYNYQYQNERSAFLADREHNEQYNSPFAQMQRYKQAGLNPALLTGQIGSGSANVDFSAPSMPGVDSTSSGSQGQFQMDQGLSGLTGGLTALASLVNQSEMTRSQVELNESQAAKNEADTGKSKKEIEKLGADISNVNMDTKLKEKQVDNVAAATEKLNYEVKELLPKQKSFLEKQMEKMTNDIVNSQQLTKAQVAHYAASVKDLIADAHLKGSQKSLIDKEVENFERKLETYVGLSSSQMQMFHSQQKMLDLQNNVMRDITGYFHDGDHFNFNNLDMLKKLMWLKVIKSLWSF